MMGPKLESCETAFRSGPAPSKLRLEGAGSNERRASVRSLTRVSSSASSGESSSTSSFIETGRLPVNWNEGSARPWVRWLDMIDALAHCDLRATPFAFVHRSEPLSLQSLPRACRKTTHGGDRDECHTFGRANGTS